MAEKPVIFLVGADKGGVGKTTVARALIDYLTIRNIKTRVFDTEHPKGDLKQFYPDGEVIDFYDTRDQMRVFDNISAEVATVVDIRAGELSPMLKALNDAYFLDDVRNGGVVLVVLHVLGPSIASLTEIAAATKTIVGGGARHLIVKNHVNDTKYDLADDPRYVDLFKTMEPGTINVPKLTELACEKVQQCQLSFAAFARGEPPGGSGMLRGYVRRWLADVSLEFDRVGIGRTVGIA